MTRALNKNTFLSLIQESLANEKNKKQGFIIIDINNFKDINDNFGHITGDFVIVEFARRLLDRPPCFSLLNQ